MRMVLAAWLAAVLLVPARNAAAVPQEKDGWLVAETEHYTVHVQKGAQNKKTKATDALILKDMSFKMELLYEKYALAFKLDKAKAPAKKAIVRLYKDRATYHAKGGPPGSAAYYSPVTKELVGYEDSEEQGIVFQIFCHEGCHQFFDLAFPGFYKSEDLPMWFSEGLADCFGSSEMRGRDLVIFTVSGVAALRIPVIKSLVAQSAFVPLKRLVLQNRVEFMSRASLSYAQAWSFVHFLWNWPSLDGPKGPYYEVVVRLIEGFKAGKPRDKVYEEAFQLKGKPLDLDELERQWKDYVTKTLRGK